MGMTGNLLRVTGTELEAYLKDSSLLENRIYNDETDEEDPNLTYIDKAWDGIIFLLTGQNFDNADHPLAKVLFSGQVIDEEQDLGYGPGQYLLPEQVKDLNEIVSKISAEDLAEKYDAKRMTELEVYPNIWGNDEADYLIEYFQEVQKAYKIASENNEAIITFIS